MKKNMMPAAIRIFLGRLPILTVKLLGGKLLHPLLSMYKKSGQRYIFIISTPRSGSSLLFHLLCNNDEITGYGENHINYNSLGDLSRLYSRTAFYFKKPRLNSRYILDKLVHNSLFISEDILNNPQAYFIFLLREAEGNMNSMSHADSSYQDGEKCLNAYKYRLDNMSQMADKLKDTGRMTVVTYADIVDNSVATLASLSDFLELETRLTDKYEKLPGTGRFRWGDNSSNILAGKILKKKITDQSCLEDEFIQHGQREYDAALIQMREQVLT